MNEETLEGAGGLKIFLRSWQPPGEPRAVVVLVHGFNSHGGQYAWVADQLVAKGLAVFALDMRGRGRSEGERFFVESFDDYVGDVARVVALAKERHPGLRVYLFGHSAGGVVSCAYTVDHQAEIDGFICESFAYRVPAPKFFLNLLTGLSRIAPHARVFKLKNERFTRDQQALAALNADPLVANEVQPAKTVAEMWRADQRLEQEFPRITLPVLILHGTEDKVTKPSGSRYFHDHVGSADKTLQLYEGHYHDLLNDTGKEAVLGDIQRWIDARLAA